MGLDPQLQARVDAVKQGLSLSGLIGRSVKLRRAGREFSGLCPFHGERTASFTVNDDKGFFHCFGCGAHGDAIGFVQALRGVSFGDALRELEGEVGTEPAAPMRRASVKHKRPSTRISSTEAGQAVWAASERAGPLVFEYLTSRGIDPRDSGVLGVVRFHPRCPITPWRAWESIDQVAETAPAMLSPICRVNGGRGARVIVQQGVHITFLAADGRGKAAFAARGAAEHRWTPASRQIWGDAAGGAVPLPAWPRHAHDARWRESPEWIDGDGELQDRARGELIVAEGLESTLSLLAAKRRARGAFAALSLNNLQGGWLADGPSLDGNPSLRLWQPSIDPERPPFTVRLAGAVTIGIDADMKGLKGRVVQDRAKGMPVRRDLSGAERSTLCAQLAAAAWRAAGAAPVKVARPPMGCDFNDVAQEKVA